jgi:hypothetical protein
VNLRMSQAISMLDAIRWLTSTRLGSFRRRDAQSVTWIVQRLARSCPKDSLKQSDMPDYVACPHNRRKSIASMPHFKMS